MSANESYGYGPGPISASAAITAKEIQGLFATTAGTVAIFDGSSASGTPLVASFTVAPATFYRLPFRINSGQVFVQIAGGAVVTMALG